MAVTRRGYIFCAFFLSVLSVLLIIVAISSDSWVVSSATAEVQVRDSNVRYGLWGGELVLNNLATPSYNSLHMTCIAEMNACAVSCKTESAARLQEVSRGHISSPSYRNTIVLNTTIWRQISLSPPLTTVFIVEALAKGYRPNQACVAVTVVDTTNPLQTPPVIKFSVYVALLTIQFLHLVLAVLAAGLAILNATKNPTEPVFGLPGCLWVNVATAVVGLTVLMLFGIYWAVSGLKDHLAFSYIALGSFQADPGLGFSYWMLLGAVLCSLVNVALIELRKYLLEKDPPPPTIKVENHSDGTIFLY